jgi:glycosyltransferase involved in cell wall biosynthesis
MKELHQTGRECSVLVDARALHVSGIGRYLREILHAVLTDPRFARVTLLGNKSALQRFAAEQNPVGRVDILPYPEHLYSARTHLAWLRLRVSGLADTDVAFFPHYDAPAFGLPARSVVTVHDLIHFEVPDLFPALQRAVAARLLNRVASGAARIITVSEATRRDLQRHVPMAASKVEVVPNGVSPVFRPMGASETAPSPLPGLARPFLLCVGNRKPHKNLGAAVESLALLRPEKPDLRLVIVGRVFPGWENVVRRASELGVRDAVLEIDEVGDNCLRWLYSHCEALVFPSLYEGFGLPLVEAMACGAPVVASNRSSIPEVVGDAGFLIDPCDPTAMAAALRALDRDQGLRREIARRGQERARRYTWKRAARRTADILYETATGSVRSSRRTAPTRAAV